MLSHELVHVLKSKMRGREKLTFVRVYVMTLGRLTKAQSRSNTAVVSAAKQCFDLKMGQIIHFYETHSLRRAMENILRFKSSAVITNTTLLLHLTLSILSKQGCTSVSVMC